MSWNTDNLAEGEQLLHCGSLTKVGRFVCDAEHPEYEFTPALDNDVFVLPRNPLWLRRNDETFLFVEPGGVLLHRAGSEIQRRQNQFGDNAYWFGIHPDLFAETLARFALPENEMGGAGILPPALRFRLTALIADIEQGVVDDLEAEEKILSIFTEICEYRSGVRQQQSGMKIDTKNRRKQLVEQAKEYIDTHLGDAISLDAVAAEIGTSPYHLCRVFKQVTGQSLNSYRTWQRLGRIVDDLVRPGSSSLNELALDAGFSSHSHMSRVFQQEVGLSPSRLRKR
jgi:AraC-like DNA-binding protein